MKPHRYTPRIVLVSLALSLAPTAQAEPPTATKKVPARWAFTRPGDPVPPAVDAEDRVRNPIDRFILARLEAAGLALAPEATKRTLARRLWFDLLGLPPTPEEVEAFVADEDPEAWEKLIDRLLADRRHGERQARWWLDLARYADTAGYEGDPDLPHAWRYRDYVIDAFNQDKPYDRFIREQLAGDEFSQVMGAGDLPGVGDEETVALTFLRLAPFTEPRGDKTRHELLSEMTSTVSSVFLGLTVGCAKCHDHKYDDIPTKDFYRLKAFFSTVKIPRPLPGDGFQIGGPLPASWYRPGEKEQVAKKRAELEQEFAATKQELDALKTRLADRAGKRALGSGFGLQAMGTSLGNDYVFDRRPVNDGQPHFALATASGGQWSFFTDDTEAGSTGQLSGSNRGQWLAAMPANAKASAHLSIGAHTNGRGDEALTEGPHRGHFAEVLLWDRALSKTELEAFAAYARAKYQTKEGGIPAPPVAGLRLWLDAGDLDANPASENPEPGAKITAWTDKIAGIRLSQTESERAPRLETLGPRGAPALRFEASLLLASTPGAAWLDDREGTIATIFSASHDGEGYGVEFGGAGSLISTFTHSSALKRQDSDLLRVATAEERELYRWLETRPRFVRQHLKRLEPKAMSLRHSYGPPYEPGVPTSRVRVRGEWDQPGEVVEAGFPSCLTGHQKPAKIRLDPFKRWPTRSRRMTLANWIASRDNPLTARVLVNRLWARHFGEGIVRTPSDFGQLSGGPSHPELLDWLAHCLTGAKWSVKAVHRLILNSATYRQSSRSHSAAALTKDPDNRLHWRFRRHRLEAEVLRDSILAVSGGLNPESYGLPIFPPLPDGIAEAVKWNESKWATDRGATARRRSIYIYQQRTLSMPFLQVFDAVVCDETRPRRPASTTSLQALSLYNGNFTNEESRRFALRVFRDTEGERSAFVRRAFLLALARRPEPEEEVLLAELLGSSQEPRQATGASEPPPELVALCRVLLNTSEFLTVD